MHYITARRNSTTEIVFKAFESEKVKAMLESIGEIKSKKMQAAYMNVAKSPQWRQILVLKNGLPPTPILLRRLAKDFGEGEYFIKNGTVGKKAHTRFTLVKIPATNRYIVKWKFRSI